MIKKVTGIVLAGAAFGAALGSLDSASAAAGFTIVGRGTWSNSAYDTGVTPSGAILRVRTSHNYPSFSTDSIYPSTNNLNYALQVRWRCDNGANGAAVNPSAYAGSNPALVVSCPGWGWMQETLTAFDDL
jgi:hypothetical protein